MGILDLFEKVVEATTETVVRLPEVPIRAVRGVFDGIDRGIEKVGESLEDE